MLVQLLKNNIAPTLIIKHLDKKHKMKRLKKAEIEAILKKIADQRDSKLTNIKKI